MRSQHRVVILTSGLRAGANLELKEMKTPLPARVALAR
jgi:hypothetical protein